MRIESRAIPEQLPELGALPPLLRRLYAARGVCSERELDRGVRALLPFTRLKGMAQAVAVLHEAVVSARPIIIVGDFDADVATASCVGVLGLRALGAAQVDYLVPNRFDYGYGLTPEIVAEAIKQEPALIITVDNGISSVAGVEAVLEDGVEIGLDVVGVDLVLVVFFVPGGPAARLLLLVLVVILVHAVYFDSP